jgi:hypothetical protein
MNSSEGLQIGPPKYIKARKTGKMPVKMVSEALVPRSSG